MKRSTLSVVVLVLTLPCHAQAKRRPQANEAPYALPKAHRPSNKQAVQKSRHLLLISIDGLSWQALRRYRGAAPNLRALARRGFARPLKSTFPSVTWPAHASMITGQRPATHGVLGNRWLDAKEQEAKPYERKDRVLPLDTPTVFELAARQRISVAALNWPNTQGLALRFNWPEHMHERVLRRTISDNLRDLLRKRLARPALKKRERDDAADQLLERVTLREGVETDLLVRDVALSLLRRKKMRPQVLALHFLLLDTWLHRYGNAPWVVRSALSLIDRWIGDVLRAYRRAGLRNKLTILVASDHGFSSASHYVSAETLLRPARLSDKELYVANNGHTAFIYLKGDSAASQRQRVAELLEQGKNTGCIRAVLPPAELVKLGLIPPKATTTQKNGSATSDMAFAVVANDHCIFTRYTGRRPTRKIRRARLGHHGTFPGRPEMRASLLGAGVGIAKLGWKKGMADIMDVAPTAAALLGLRWPKKNTSGQRFTLDGKVLEDILRK